MVTTAAPPFRASRYTTGAILLHWSIALLILAQLGGGWAMNHLLDEGTALQFQVFQLHKSIGITILVLTVARILWRTFNPPPPKPASVSRVEGAVAHAVHLTFYALLLLIPLLGWLLITVSPVQIETVLYFVERLPWPHLPGFDRLPADARLELAHLTERAHAVLAYFAAGLVALHVAGALKHHIQDGKYIARMSVGAGGHGPRNSYGHATTWLATVIFFGAMVGAATWARAPEPVVAGVSPDQRTVLAALPRVEAPAPAPAADGGATAWTVDPAASRLGFLATYSGRDVPGGFQRWTAAVRFDPEDLSGSSVEVVIDLSSAFAEGTAITPAQLTGPDGFAATDGAVATFTSDAIRAEGDGYVADGTLTLRGETRPVALPFAVAIEGDVARASGSLTLDRFEWGIGVQNDPDGQWIGRTVNVTVEVIATRGAPIPAAAAATPPAGAEAQGELEPWTVVPDESAVGFAFDFQGARVGGAIGGFEAAIRFDEDRLDASSVDVTLDLGTATVEGTAVTVNQLRGPDGLDAAAAGTAHFRSDAITRTETGFRADGELTLRGVTAPVALDFTLARDGARAVAEGTARLDRLAFGVGRQNDPAGDWISPEVTVEVRVTAIEPGAAAETAATR